jgi:hypothetical protein
MVRAQVPSLDCPVVCGRERTFRIAFEAGDGVKRPVVVAGRRDRKVAALAKRTRFQGEGHVGFRVSLETNVNAAAVTVNGLTAKKVKNLFDAEQRTCPNVHIQAFGFYRVAVQCMWSKAINIRVGMKVANHHGNDEAVAGPR